MDSINDVRDAETQMTASEVVANSFLENAGDASSEEGDVIDKQAASRGALKAATPPLGLADAFIAAGAQTVLQKLWYDEDSSLADVVSGSR